MPRFPKKSRPLRVYFASELYHFKHLIGNAYLAEAIYEKSHGRYLCELPQDFEPGGAPRPHAIRDGAIRTLVSCDLALFSFDGADIDSATAIEFMIAKFADIPAVILRSDLRAAGDGSDAWTLMASYYPRTLKVVLDGLASYKSIVRRRRRLDEVLRLAGQHGSADAQRMCDEVAEACVRSFDKVLEIEPTMPKYVREEVYHWLALMAGIRGKGKELRKEFERHLERKVQRGLL